MTLLALNNWALIFNATSQLSHIEAAPKVNWLAWHDLNSVDWAVNSKPTNHNAISSVADTEVQSLFPSSAT